MPDNIPQEYLQELLNAFMKGISDAQQKLPGDTQKDQNLAFCYGQGFATFKKSQAIAAAQKRGPHV